MQRPHRMYVALPLFKSDPFFPCLARIMFREIGLFDSGPEDHFQNILYRQIVHLLTLWSKPCTRYATSSNMHTMPLKLTVRRRRRPSVKRRSKERGKRHSQSIYISPFTGYPDTQAGLVDSGTYSDRAPCEGWDRANTRAELVSSRSEWWIFFSLHGGGEIYFLTSPLFRISVIDASWMGEALIWWNVRKNCSTCRILLRR